jgi:hypothetical protein
VQQKLKLILFAALSAALTVAGLSIAAGGGSSGSASKSPSDREVFRETAGGPPGMQRFDANVADVMRQIHDAVEQKLPEIADPIIQKAQDAGDITSSQADTLRSLVKDMAAEKPPSGDPRALFGDSHVRAVLQSIFQAKAKEAATIGEPIIQKAVDEKKITSAQADQIRSRLKNPPPFGRGRKFGPGFGPGHGPGGHFFGHFDQNVANVLGDIHGAVEKKAPEIADPIIKKAEDAGDITSSQADKLRAAAQDIANGKRPAVDPGTLLGDAKVRKVVEDAFAASAKQAPAIAEPIIQKAVDDKKITSAQADQIRNELKDLKAGLRSFRGGPPPFAGPGGRHRGGLRGFERPRGIAPGAFPGGYAPGAQPAVEAPAARPA